MNKQNKNILEDVKLKLAISNFEEEEQEVMKCNKKSIFKVAVVACCIIILTTGGVFAKDITSFIKNLFGINTSDGVDTAVNNGYIGDIKTEYQNANGIEINIDSVLIDDFNFAMNFNIFLDEQYDIDEFDGVQITDLKIIDENENIVFNTYETYISELTTEELKEKGYKGGYSFVVNKKDNNHLMVSLVATGSEEAFPKSKHLSVTFSNLSVSKLVYIDDIEQKERANYKGNWEFDIDVPEEFYERKTIIYKAKECTDEGININEITATLSNTGFKISIPTITTDKVDYDLLYTSTPKSIYDKMALQKEYVETSTGKRFETSQINDGDSGYSVPQEEQRIINYHQTFNLTSYDATDDITVHIFTNKGEEIIIELERSK